MAGRNPMLEEVEAEGLVWAAVVLGSRMLALLGLQDSR